MGSKSRFSKEILSIILKDRQPNQFYIEPFCGGCNVIDKVTGNRIANDYNKYLIAMWDALVTYDWIPPVITLDEYRNIRDNKEKYPDKMVGWAGFACSFRGKFFGGFTKVTDTKDGKVRDYQREHRNNIFAQIPNLKSTTFLNFSYDELPMPPNSIVYCDPPYRDTTGYNNEIDHDKFWDWAKNETLNGHSVFVSEYNAPNGWSAVWEKETKSSLSRTNASGGWKNSLEKIFVYKG